MPRSEGVMQRLRNICSTCFTIDYMSSTDPPLLVATPSSRLAMAGQQVRLSCQAEVSRMSPNVS